MLEHHIRAILEGNGGWPGNMLKSALWPAGKLYGLAMAARREAYRRGILPSAAAPVPVIAVGNLTAGGTGKTPFTLMLARLLLGLRRRPAILLRGYRQSAAGESDEAELYRRELPEVLVVTGADRRVSAARAVRQGAEVIILDDGFQHLRLRRNLDIVLIDATSPWGGGNPFPAGLLRENPAALGNAGCVCLTRADQVETKVLAGLKERVAALAPRAMLLTATHAPQRLTHMTGVDKGATELPLKALNGQRVVALAGIARPEAFVRTLEGLGASVVGRFFAGDHVVFSQTLLKRCFSLANQREALVVTTEKDVTKGIWGTFRGEQADNNKGAAGNARVGVAGAKVNPAHTGGVLVLGIDMRVDAPERFLDLLRGALP